jgi:tetratricopeptide (TPR) repeat protein
MLSDNIPDFDSMSPEEIQAWMETLAERQGATEGFISENRVEVAEIDPTTVNIQDNYIPYGKTAEEWARIQEEERANRQAKTQSAPQSVQQPESQPAPEPVAPASAENDVLPDFDSMTPEQLQAWMETLAERQGATEGFISDERVEVAEIDPTTVDIQDNYIPYGKTADEWARIQEEERLARQARTKPEPQAPQAVSQSAPEPVADEMDWLSELANPLDEPAAQLESVDLSALGLDLNAPDLSDGLPDIESLDFSGLDDIDLDFNLDDLELSGLAESVGDPMEWLDGLMNDEEPLSTPASQPALDLPMFDDDDGSTDTLEWLNTLAGQAEELPQSDALLFDEANDWLNELAEDDARPDADGLTESVMEDLKRGISDPDTMKAWMDNMLELGASRDDVTDYDFEDEQPEQLKPEVPDWLLEMENVPDQLKTDTVPAVSDAQFISDLGLDELEEPEMGDWLTGEFGDVEAESDLIYQAQQPAEESADDWLEGQPVANIPDWLLEDMPEGTDDIQAIFSPPNLIEEDGLDQTDSWVEAFELEREMRARGLEDIPEEWLDGDLPKVDTSVIRESVITGQVILQEAVFPDREEWDAGEPEPVPAWMGQTPREAEPVAQAEPVVDESDFPDWLRLNVEDDQEIEAVPDWLSDSGVQDIESVPDWLLSDTGMLNPRVVAEDVIIDSTPKPETPAIVPVRQPEPKPAITLGSVDPRQFLQKAREKLQQGAINESLQDYEVVVKVNQEVEVVVEDLSKLVKEGPHKHNPAVHRVLGDGLMRQGKLQEALDTYRKALNLL